MMKKLAVFLMLFLAVTAMAMDRRVDVIDGEYIVVLHKNADLHTHLNKMSAFVSDVNIMHKYTIGSFKGYAVRDFYKGNLAALLQSPDVAYISPNQMAYSIACHEARSDSWGLQRTSLKGALPGNPPITQIPYKWADNACGAGIEAHVIDTGIYTEHNDFGGRAVFGADFVGEGPGDGNGHGTHVASTLGGTNYGVARCTPKIVAVKVLSRGGSGSFAGVIAGVEYSAEAARQSKVVANMSLGGGRNQALNDACTAAVQGGLLLVVAAGNDNRDAANYSPASADRVWTIGSTDSNDSRSSFSNWGTTVDIFAPGGQITAAWIGGPTATRTISGTSMASPHAAGVATKYWSANPSVGPEDVMRALESQSNQGVVNNPGTGSPNRLVFMDC